MGEGESKDEEVCSQLSRQNELLSRRGALSA